MADMEFWAAVNASLAFYGQSGASFAEIRSVESETAEANRAANLIISQRAARPLPRLIIDDESTLESLLDDLHGRWENLRDDNASETPTAWDIAAAIEFLESAPVAFPMALEFDDSNIALQVTESFLNLRDGYCEEAATLNAHWENLDA